MECVLPVKIGLATGEKHKQNQNDDAPHDNGRAGHIWWARILSDDGFGITMADGIGAAQTVPPFNIFYFKIPNAISRKMPGWLSNSRNVSRYMISSLSITMISSQFCGVDSRCAMDKMVVLRSSLSFSISY